MDHLLKGHSAFLYSLFELAHRPDSKFVLIGIANGLDMISRSLPRLSAKQSNDLHFSYRHDNDTAF